MICQFFIAMTEFKLGHASEAEAAFARGTDLLKRNGPAGDQFDVWALKEWIIADQARKQAAALLGHPVDPPATQAGDTTQ